MGKLTKEMRADCSECGGVKRVEASNIAEARDMFIKLGWEMDGDLWVCSRCIKILRKKKSVIL